uniref:Uncharacterized protein n=1 Tax=Prevotella sp. GTC17259 TaxID=3236795 RepID=A0AB33J810_9BACT
MPLRLESGCHFVKKILDKAVDWLSKIGILFMDMETVALLGSVLFATILSVITLKHTDVR